ncbi:hypothetical protein BC940DRAFT_299532 [Gongronella butleri]|nr:hypothetical protein BC940DRAFT_299532 [Gongronella butleri]
MQVYLQKYQQLLIERPIRTYAIQSGTLQLVGDTVAQQLIERRGKDHDPWRSARMFTYGFAIGGPTVVSWFRFQLKYIKLSNRWKTAAARSAADIFLFTPTILAIFMTGISVLEGRNVDQIREKFDTSYVQGVYNAYHFWPFASLFTQAFVPMLYRPMVNSCFSITWNSYLSYFNQQSLDAINKSKAAAASTTVATPQRISAT